MKFNGEMPLDSMSISAFFEQLLQNDKANLQIDIAATLAGGMSRGICVYWDKLNGRWVATDGLNPPKNTVLGIVESVEGMSGQVRVGGVYQEQTIAANSVYYAAANGKLTTVHSRLIVGRSTSSGLLTLVVNGGSGSGSGGGSVGDFAWRNYIKENEIKANGALVSRLEYRDLWEHASDKGLVKTETQWSGGLYGFFASGDGANTFRVPDLRGVVIRGLDESKGYDNGRVLGSYQGDVIGAHNHTSGVRTGVNIYGANGTASGSLAGMNIVGEATRASPYTSTDGGAETRMKNIALYACIRFE